MKITSLLLILISCFIVLYVSGCASYIAKHIDQKPLATYSKQTNKYGIILAAEPITDNNQAMKMLTLNPNRKGYLPIDVVLSNTAGDNVLTDSSNITLTDASGTIKSPIKSDIVASNFEHDKRMEALIGFGLVSYMMANEANRKMYQDWSDKSFPTNKILNANNGYANGIIFFQVDAKQISGSTLIVPVTNLKTNTVVQLQVKL